MNLNVHQLWKSNLGLFEFDSNNWLKTLSKIPLSNNEYEIFMDQSYKILISEAWFM